jgi:hypothetical protein
MKNYFQIGPAIKKVWPPLFYNIEENRFKAMPELISTPNPRSLNEKDSKRNTSGQMGIQKNNNKAFKNIFFGALYLPTCIIFILSNH